MSTLHCYNHASALCTAHSHTTCTHFSGRFELYAHRLLRAPFYLAGLSYTPTAYFGCMLSILLEMFIFYNEAINLGRAPMDDFKTKAQIYRAFVAGDLVLVLAWSCLSACVCLRCCTSAVRSCRPSASFSLFPSAFLPPLSAAFFPPHYSPTSPSLLQARAPLSLFLLRLSP